MKVLSAEYIQGGLKAADWPEAVMPEIALVGRSNVGKSSLINHCVNRKKLARTSQVPGKTRLLNFYLINGKIMLVDLPGYGFTRAPVPVNRVWRRAIDMYIRNRTTLRCLCHLVDCRHPGLAVDIQVSTWLQSTGIPVITVATKSDKLSRHRLAGQLATHRKSLFLTDEAPILPFSIYTSNSREMFWQHIEICLKDDICVNPAAG